MLEKNKHKISKGYKFRRFRCFPSSEWTASHVAKLCSQSANFIFCEIKFQRIRGICSPSNICAVWYTMYIENSNTLFAFNFNNTHVQKKQERDHRKQQHSDKRKREIDRKILEAIKVSQRACTEYDCQHYLLHLIAYFGSLAKLLA